MKREYYTSRHMHDEPFEGIARAQKRELSRKIAELYAAWVASGNRPTRCGPPTYEHMVKRNSWRPTGEKKAPTRVV